MTELRLSPVPAAVSVAPSLKHLPIIRYIPLDEFAELKRYGYELGFAHVESGPLVRSSYHASDAV